MPAKQPKITKIALLTSGKAREAIFNPKKSPIKQSKKTTNIVLVLILPCFFFSLLKLGFQWGSVSRTKWERKARGRDRRGLPIL